MPGSTAIFWPMIGQALLVLIVYLVIFKRRVDSTKRGETKLSDYRLPYGEPEASAAAARNLANQFELPVLFFVVCLSLYVTNGSNYVAVALAWLFVFFRAVHAWVHMTGNDVRLRGPLFMIGLLIVVVLWVWLAIHLAAHI